MRRPGSCVNIWHRLHVGEGSNPWHWDLPSVNEIEVGLGERDRRRHAMRGHSETLKFTGLQKSFLNCTYDPQKHFKLTTESVMSV